MKKGALRRKRNRIGRPPASRPGQPRHHARRGSSQLQGKSAGSKPGRADFSESPLPAASCV